MQTITKKIFPIIFTFFLLVSCSREKSEIIPQFHFTAYLDTIIQDWEGQKIFIEEYRRLTGIELNIIQPPHQLYMDKLLVSFTETDSPQVCEILPEYLPLLISRKIAMPLDDFISESEYIKDFNPHFLDSLRSHDGKIYGFPSRDGGGCVTYIRKDWLDNLGLPIPETWDDFYTMLQAFTYNDPDGNGVNDTKGYTDVSSASRDWYNRAVMLNGRTEIYFNNGKWIDGFTEPAMLEALERLRRIYQEGLVDSNIPTNTTFTARNRFINGDVGVITYWGNHWARNMLERTRAISGENVEIIPIPPLKGGYYIKRVAPMLIITTKTQDPKKVFSYFIDKQYDKSDIQTLFTYGVKGYHWDNIDGKPEFLINENDPYKVPFTKAFVPPIAVINDWQQPMDVDEVILPALNILKKYSIQEKIKQGKVYYNQYYMEIERVLKPEIISQIINDEITVEEGMKLYEKKSSGLFIDLILAELNGE
jgi:putative aldouronate transport system substrate-binding protein